MTLVNANNIIDTVTASDLGLATVATSGGPRGLRFSPIKKPPHLSVRRLAINKSTYLRSAGHSLRLRRNDFQIIVEPELRGINIILSGDLHHV